MDILGPPDGRPERLVLRALALGDLLAVVPTLQALHRSRTGASRGSRRIDTAVNLRGRGPQSHRLLEALEPRHRIGHRAPGWAGSGTRQFRVVPLAIATGDVLGATCTGRDPVPTRTARFLSSALTKAH